MATDCGAGRSARMWRGSSSPHPLLTLASALDSHRWMPERDVDSRAPVSVPCSAVSDGRPCTAERLVCRIEGLSGLSSGKGRIIERALAAVRNGEAVRGVTRSWF